MDAEREWPADHVERRPLAELIPNARNARTHSEAQIGQIAASIREWGWTMPVLVDEAGSIIAGHGRVLAAQRLGIGEVPTMVARGWSEAQKRAYVIADNKLTENGGWDSAMLRVELKDIEAMGFDAMLTGFSAQEIKAMGTIGKTDPDEVPEAPAVPISRRGDNWLLGEHRLLCGDATCAEDVQAATGGQQVQMVFTNPPYGVDYTGGMKKRDRLKGDHVGTDIYFGALQHLGFAADDSAALYLWYADGHAAAAAAAAAAAGYQIVAQIIWAKNHAQFMTAAHYKGKHEPCYYGHRRGKSARWYGPNNEVTLWSYDRSPRNDYHPTQKPIALAERAIGNSSAAGDIVLDMFVGSGSNDHCG